MSLQIRQHLPAIAALTGIVPVSMGIYGVLNPSAAIQTAFQWKQPQIPEDRRVLFSMMKLYSFRSIGLGLGGLSIWWFSGGRRAQGLYMLSSVIIAVGDGLTCYQQSGGVFAEGMKHWFAIPIGLGLGAGLLDWI